jgi:hypothetical protein
MAAFDRFGKQWATGGGLDNPSDAEADAGFIFLGPEPPTVEQFNSLFKWNDEKDNWLYGQIADVIRHDGTPPVENDLTQLLVAINELISLAVAGGTAQFVKKTGDNMSGFLTLHSNPQQAMHAATKQYVDILIGNYVARGGDSMTGFLTLHAEPQQPMHAATKAYADRYAVDQNLFVRKSGDTMTGRLRTTEMEVFSPNGMWGGGGNITWGANINYRWGLVVDGDGNLLLGVCDNGNWGWQATFARGTTYIHGTQIVENGQNVSGWQNVYGSQYVSGAITTSDVHGSGSLNAPYIRAFSTTAQWGKNGGQIAVGAHAGYCWVLGTDEAGTLYIGNIQGDTWIGAPITITSGQVLTNVQLYAQQEINGPYIHSRTSMYAVDDISCGRNITANVNLSGGAGVIAGYNGFYSQDAGVNVGGEIRTRSSYWGTGIYINGRYNGGDMELVGMISGDPLIARSDLRVILDVLCERQGYKAGGGAWAAISDERVKQNVTVYERGLSDVLLLEPKEYSYTEESGYDTSIRYVGLISQEVQPIIPEMVYVNTTIGKRNEYPEPNYPDGFPEEMKVVMEPKPSSDIPDLLCMDTSALPFMLVNAIKELAARVTTLEAAP